MLSVVTVVLNAEDDILRTLASVAMQTCAPVEHLVVDGGSRDGTLERVRQWQSAFVRLIEISDSGPYDAMNKAAAFAEGDYLIFLNAGDVFADEAVIEKLIAAAYYGKRVIVSDHFYVQNGVKRYRKCQPLDSTMDKLRRGELSTKWLEGIPCHQSTAYRKDVLAESFDTSYEIAADHDLLFRLMRAELSYYQIAGPTALYYGGGLSAQRFSRCKLEWYDIAKSHSENPSGVDAFYAKSSGYTLPNRKNWLPISGLHLEEGPYPRHGIDFRFRWTSEPMARLAVMGGPADGNVLRISIMGGGLTVNVSLSAQDIHETFALGPGRDKRELLVNLSSNVKYPLIVDLHVDPVTFVHSDNRSLGIMVLGTEVLGAESAIDRRVGNLAQAPERVAEGLLNAISSIGKRRLRRKYA